MVHGDAVAVLVLMVVVGAVRKIAWSIRSVALVLPRSPHGGSSFSISVPIIHEIRVVAPPRWFRSNLWDVCLFFVKIESKLKEPDGGSVGMQAGDGWVNLWIV